MSSKPYKRVKPIKDREFYDAYLLAHPSCEACFSRINLTRHHIVRFGRSDEWSNLLVLCVRCHELADGSQHVNRETGESYGLTMGVCLNLKYHSDKNAFDYQRLRALLGRPLPDPQPLPKWVIEERARNRRRR